MEPNGGLATTIFPQFSRDARTGKAVLQFGRIGFARSDVRYRLVAELDGEVKVAFLQTEEQCELVDYGLAAPRYLFYVSSRELPTGDGLLAGVVGERYPDPAFVRTGEDCTTTRWWVTPGWFLAEKNGAISGDSWDGRRKGVAVYDPSAFGFMRPSYVSESQTAAFIQVDSALFKGIVSWTLEGGARAFLLWPDPPWRSAGNFATDGKDMVWLYAENVEPGTLGNLKSLALMSAPFTTDPGVVEKTARRVADFPGGFGVWPPVVGCGYAAANRFLENGPRGALLVFRLEDGAVWTVPGSPNVGDWQFSQVLGINCASDGTAPEVVAIISNALDWDLAEIIVRIPIPDLGKKSDAP